MSITYTAGVFYGTFVASSSPLGQRLDKFIDEHGGMPAPAGIEGVEIGMIGDIMNGDTELVVMVKGSERSFSRDRAQGGAAHGRWQRSAYAGRRARRYITKLDTSPHREGS